MGDHALASITPQGKHQIEIGSRDLGAAPSGSTIYGADTEFDRARQRMRKMLGKERPTISPHNTNGVAANDNVPFALTA